MTSKSTHQPLSHKHLLELCQVLQRLREGKLHARPSKCQIAKTTVDFVSHCVVGDRIEPRQALIQSINEYPKPKTKKQVRYFLGMVGHYRKFIPTFSERAAVLTDLTRGKNPTKVKWLQQQQQFIIRDDLLQY